MTKSKNISILSQLSSVNGIAHCPKNSEWKDMPMKLNAVTSVVLEEAADHCFFH